MARYPVAYRSGSRSFHDSGSQKFRDRLTRTPSPGGKMRDFSPDPYADENYRFADDENLGEDRSPRYTRRLQPANFNPNRFGKRMRKRLPYLLPPPARNILQWMQLARRLLDLISILQGQWDNHGNPSYPACPGSPDVPLKGLYTSQGTDCGALLTFSTGNWEALHVIGPADNYSYHQVISRDNDFVYTRAIQDYVNFNGAPSQSTTVVLTEVLPPLPWLWPALDPFGLPIDAMVPTPRPIPYRMIPYMGPNPNRALGEQTQGGNTVRTQEEDAPKGARPRQLSPKPLVRDPPLPDHQLAKPKPREKERKFIFAVDPKSKLGKIFNAATETRDFIEQLHYSLPKKHWVHASFYKDPTGKWRKHNPSISEMSWAIYKHAGELDVNKAIINILKMEIGDAMAGTLGKQSGKAQRRLHDKGYSPPRNPGLYSRGF